MQTRLRSGIEQILEERLGICQKLKRCVFVVEILRIDVGQTCRHVIFIEEINLGIFFQKFWVRLTQFLKRSDGGGNAVELSLKRGKLCIKRGIGTLSSAKIFCRLLKIAVDLNIFFL